MKVVHAFGRVYDLFDGEGWENWTRFALSPGKNGMFFQFVDGRSLTKEMLGRLSQNFQHKQHYQNI